MRVVVQKAGRISYWLPVDERRWAKFDLLMILVRPNLEARYKGSVLGNLWPLLNQLSPLLIYTYVFSIVLQGLPANNLTFGLWLFAGLLTWIAFTSLFMQADGSVVGQPNLVKRVMFSLALLSLVSVLSAFIESTFGLMALFVLVSLTSMLYNAPSNSLDVHRSINMKLYEAFA